MPSLKSLALKGTLWTIIGYGASQILRFGSNLILTRLLFPEIFGLMTLVYTFIVGLSLFSDIGINPGIIRSDRGDDPEFLNTAWTLQVLRSIVIWFCCLAIAFPAAQIYNEPQLRWLIPIVGFNVILAGFKSTAVITLNRHLAIAKLTLVNLTLQIISIAVMVAWASFHPTIWALIVGNTVSSLLELFVSHRLIPGTKNTFAWDRSAVKELLSFGTWVFISTAMTFLASQSDRLILGKVLSIEMLGIYSIAFTLSEVPRQVVLAVSDRVIFPAISKLGDLPREAMLAKLEKPRFPVLIALAFGLAILTVFGDLLIRFLYDARYDEAGWMLPILALGIWPIVLTQSLDSCLFVIGKIRSVVVGTFLSFLVLAIGIPLGTRFWGPIGAVSAVALSNVPPYIAITFGLWRHRLACLKQDLITTVLFVGFLALFVWGRSALGWGYPW
ncbi:oligosaccharide flippase family protein [Lusitaniella coriacea]|uniref:oligosaccharide flippase family protein n=1 Tax=Lusitaniella coriacea TaxID=1983105 RepID=UPI003CFBC0DC